VLVLQIIRTYIQSGNVVFDYKVADSAKLSAQDGAAIRKSHGFEPKVLLLVAAKLE
jgi:uncharacterized protein (DUF1697 family)